MPSKWANRVAHSQPVSRELYGEESGAVEEIRSFGMDQLIDAEDCRTHSFAIGRKVSGIPVLSWYGPVREEKLIDAEPHFLRHVEEVAGCQSFTMAGATLESMGLPLKDSAALKAARQ